MHLNTLADDVHLMQTPLGINTELRSDLIFGTQDCCWSDTHCIVYPALWLSQHCTRLRQDHSADSRLRSTAVKTNGV